LIFAVRSSYSFLGVLLVVLVGFLGRLGSLSGGNVRGSLSLLLGELLSFLDFGGLLDLNDRLLGESGSRLRGSLLLSNGNIVISIGIR
jgi:hypothetical protein